MPTRSKSLRYYRFASALGFVLVIAGCTKGGQFDPTELVNNDMFETKKKLKGDREAVFPGGVPGTTTGVPADLVKGYQAPPEPADADAAAPAPAPATAEAEKPKPKPKPKPKLAAQKPAAPAPTRISVGPAASKPYGADQQAAPWPSPQQATSGQPAAQSQSVWPSPNQTPPPQQTAQPSQSVWPNPPAPRTTTQ
jgi:hypothetical protein